LSVTVLPALKQAAEQAEKTQKQKEEKQEPMTGDWRTTTLTGKVLQTTQTPSSKILQRTPDYLLSPQQKQAAEQKIVGPTGMVSKGSTAGFVSPFESVVRPDIPTPSGYVVTSAIGTVSPEHREAAEQTLRELTELGPGYTIGSLGGEAVLAWLTGKAVGKGLEAASKTRVGQKIGAKIPGKIKSVFVKQEKVVTKQTEVLPRKAPYRWLSKSPSRTILMPMEETGKAGAAAFKVSVSRGAKTPFSKTLEAVTKTGQSLLLQTGLKQTPTLTVKAIPKTALAGQLAIKSALRGSVQVVSKPTTVAKILPYLVGPTVKAVTQATKPKTAVKAKTSVETVSQMEVKHSKKITVSTPKVSSRPFLGGRLTPKLDFNLKSPVTPKVSSQLGVSLETPSIFEVPQIQKARQVQRLQQKQSQRQIQKQIEVPRFIQISRVKPPRFNLSPPRPRRRKAKKAKGLAGWFERRHPIRGPSEVMRMLIGGSSARKKTRRTKRRRRKR